MTSSPIVLDAQSAVRYLGQTVLMEMVWDEEPEPIWRWVRVVGVVLPAEGLRGGPHFLTLKLGADKAFADEAFWENIRTIRVMRYRDRQGSGNVLGRVTHPDDSRSRAALPARRNSPAVPANGSTGGANP
ncbi:MULTISPECIES: hypothetical protein [Pseudomonas]|uniref:hypothetical protein n=1 Tax=Pseudomonas TaxID=286 RepID=UPI00044D4FEB|nr:MULTISPECIES: hypothetical protein [Pseudomonas]EKB8024562.1 hypothetical protein [Pseudomonas aeruginosa]EKT7962906.1 hypothetical protein [Pseudomonas aeruginosa]EZN60331.1 hypothetical protein AJ72_05476 [Pseudomonas aeruginosa BWH032]KAA2297461.1 hypothetical protein F1C11_16810 [Pseudomonas aeruginosa]MBA5007335.1 hypothetical protein [Pseudomonas aeruginosa]